MSATKQHPFAAVILAAGAGTRYGEPKAGAKLPDGATFLETVIARCQVVGADPIIAVVAADRDVPAPARKVVNAKATSEQIISLRLGLAALANTDAAGALVWPVDHPHALETSGLAVVDAARRTLAPIVVPVHDGKRGHPVWFGRETWRELVTVPDGGARAVVAAYGNRVLEVAVGDDGVLRDIDERDS